MANDRSSGMRDNDTQDSSSQDPAQPDDTSRPPATHTDVPSRKEESGFSFKHFLRNSGDSATSSSSVNGVSSATSSCTAPKPGLRTSTSSSSSSSSMQPNLGARPKVPHYSLHNGLDQQQTQQQLPRMKRSPKFPSFDSHASLAEYSEEVSSNFVQRSHSNYEVETPSAATFSRRSPVNHQYQALMGSREATLCNSPSGSGTNRTTSDYQAALPDFVKDHMVLEQWYQTNPFRSGESNELAGTSSSPPSAEGHPQGVELEPLGRRSFHNSNLFDLALGSGGGGGSSFRLATNSPTVPLDLPTYDLGGNSSSNERIQGNPLDLPPQHSHRFSGVDRPSHPSHPVGDIPLDLTERHRVNSRNDSHRNESPPPSSVQADMIQTLPDFLSDGPIHSSGRLADVAQDLPQLDSPEENAAVNVISRLRLENDRLRHELDEARRLISDQGRQINDLERSCRSGEIQRNGTVLERNRLNQRIAQLTVRERGELRLEKELGNINCGFVCRRKLVH